MAHKPATEPTHETVATLQAKSEDTVPGDFPTGNGAPLQKKANQTGLPDNLKAGIESLSGLSMDDVKVHYDSAKPARLNAHAYAQGTDIHVAPGQTKHVPHEAWHVVQQKQGRVKPTLQMKGKININDNAGLEKEADVWGEKAMQLRAYAPQTHAMRNTGAGAVAQQTPVVQRTLDHAIAAGARFGQHFTTKEEIIAYLTAQPEPAMDVEGETVDSIRREYNRDNPDKIQYLDIWPEPEAAEVTNARQWVATFLSTKNVKGMAAANGLQPVVDTIRKVGKDRKGSGLDMLNKFVFYVMHGVEILNRLFENFSQEYKTALNNQLSVQLNKYGHAAVNDEIFKEIPGDADGAVLAIMGAEGFMEPLRAGYTHLQASIDARYDMEVIVHYYFLHDKGYLNASAPLTGATAKHHKTMIDQAKAQELKSREEGWKNPSAKNRYDHTDALLGRKGLDRNSGTNK